MKESVKTKFNAFPHHTRFLLAMSGGIDSCVLFELMKSQKINFAVAHANFGLRGKASDEDEVFVRHICSENDIPFFTKKLDVYTFKESHNDSTQSAARKLRYTWFQELMQEENFDVLVTAHHLDDAIETFFINLLRGTGLRGLTGISENQIFRPLLEVPKAEIHHYAKKNHILWREDASNATDDYLRNKIRHKLIPEIHQIEPEFHERFAKTFDFLQNDVEILSKYVENLKSKLFHAKQHTIEISIQELEKLNLNEIFYLFETYGFTSPNEIVKLFNAQESAEIQSKSHRLIKNRGVLLLYARKIQNKRNYLIEDLQAFDSPVSIKFRVHKENPKSNLTLLDYDKIKFPLSLRLSKIGDVFCPKGMNGKSKKVSKYFKDEKFSKIQKENTWLLTDAKDEILCILGHRLDERFLPTKQTKKWLEIELLD